MAKKKAKIVRYASVGVRRGARAVKRNTRDLLTRQGLGSLVKEVGSEAVAALGAITVDLVCKNYKLSGGSTLAVGTGIKVVSKLVGQGKMGGLINVGIMARRGPDALAQVLPSAIGAAIKAVS